MHDCTGKIFSLAFVFVICGTFLQIGYCHESQSDPLTTDTEQAGKNIRSLEQKNRLSVLQEIQQKQARKIKAQHEQMNAIREKIKNQELLPVRIGRQMQTPSPTIVRTCHELRSANPELNSGYYWIDPDGVGVGDRAIRVFCNMTSGTTFVPHDSEETLPVTECPDPGCYSRNIRYNATTRQIRSLIQLSSVCRQSIRYDCVESPLEHDGVTYSWWTDRSGDKKTFWVGRNSSKHTCLCGLTRQCVDRELDCNCDAMSRAPQMDQGFITHKEILPVMSVHFGNTKSQSRHSIGRLECSGRASVNGIPSSCRDLQILGNVASGIYSVKNVNNTLNSVYCDFSKTADDPGFHQSLNTGRSSNVFSHAISSTSEPAPTLFSDNPYLKYQTVKVNEGGAMDRHSGIFTVPRSGFYLFIIAYGAYPGGSVELYLNNQSLWKAYRSPYPYFVTAFRRVGDIVYTIGSYLVDSDYGSSWDTEHVYFSGLLLP